MALWQFCKRKTSAADAQAADKQRYKAIVSQIKKLRNESLDDDATKSRFTEYHQQAKTKDYNKTWNRRFEVIAQVIEQRKELHLGRVLGIVAREQERARDMYFQPGEHIVLGQEFGLPMRSMQRMHRGTIVESVADACTDETSKIVEMGSGWSEHLGLIFSEGGPRDADYYACEISESGRKCAEMLTLLDHQFKLQSAAFNYTEPEKTRLPAARKHAVVYSVQSVEQVEHVSDDLVQWMCEQAPQVTGLHFEPIGWQMDDNLETAPPWVGEFHKRCEEFSYNRNLWPLLQQAQDQGQIKIETAEPYFLGHTYNPVCLIKWQKVN